MCASACSVRKKLVERLGKVHLTRAQAEAVGVDEEVGQVEELWTQHTRHHLLLTHWHLPPGSCRKPGASRNPGVQHKLKRA
jgi:hypothetical protein